MDYGAGSLPFLIRWFAHFDNAAGEEAKGVQCPDLVSRQGHYTGWKPTAWNGGCGLVRFPDYRSNQ